jgi:hypothetical protein
MVKNREESDEEDDEEDDQEDDQEKFFFEHPDAGIDWVKKHPGVAIDKDQYVERLHPNYWLRAARSLQYSADIIFEHERPFAETLHAVAISKLDKSQPNLAGARLLYAFAFENLLKGIIIARNPDIRDPAIWGTTAEDEKLLRKARGDEWMSHDVKKLLQLANISIPAPYLRLLWIFEGIAVWRGRYPAARSAPRSVRLDDEGLPDSIQWPDHSDHKMVSELFRILESELVRLIPPE